MAVARGWRIAWWTALLGALVSACGDGDDDGGPEPTERVSLEVGTIVGGIELPVASRQAVEQLTVATVLGQATPAEDGSFTVPAFTGGPVFAVASNAAGTPLLLGWLDPDDPVLDARGTAEALVLLNAGSLLSPEMQALALQLVGEAPEIDELEAALFAALIDGAEPLADAEVQAALRAACAAPAGDAGGRDVAVSPPVDKSGISVLHDRGLNSVQIVNAYRRRVHVYVDRIAYVPAGGGPAVAADMAWRQFTGPLPSTATDEATTFGELFGDQWTYAPARSEPFELKMLPEDADKTVYRVTVTGPSLGTPGDADSMPAERRQEAERRRLECLAADLLLPVLADVTVPVSVDGLGALFDAPAAAPLVADLADLAAAAAPEAVAKLNSGDYRGAGEDLIVALCGPSVFRLSCFHRLLEAIEQTAAETESPAVAQIADALTAALSSPEAITDRFGDLLAGSRYAECAAADAWRLEVTKSRVVLDPPTAVVSIDDEETLQVEFSDGEPTPEVAQQLSYKFTCTGRAGQITNSEHLPGVNEFQTTVNWVKYLANQDVEGEDTVTVEVSRTEGGETTLIGTATSTLTVRDRRVELRIEPANPEVAPGGRVELTAVADPPITEPERYQYWWMTTNDFGKLQGDEAIQKDWHRGQVTDSYGAFSLSGSDTVFCQLYRRDGDELVSVAQASTLVTVTEIPEAQLIWVDPYAANETTIAAGAWFQFEKVPGAIRYHFWLHTHGHPWPKQQSRYRYDDVIMERLRGVWFDPLPFTMYDINGEWRESAGGGGQWYFSDVREWYGQQVPEDEWVLHIGNLSAQFTDPYGVMQQPGWLWGRYDATDLRARWEEWLNEARHWTLRYRAVTQ